MAPATVLFACIHNAGRSQMGAAVFNLLSDPSKAVAVSAGTQPAAHVHPEVLQVTKRHGIDLSGKTPQLLTKELAETASLLITMGCGEACPYVPGLEKLDWPLTDPKGKSEEEVEVIFKEVEGLVKDLLQSKGWV